MRIGQKYITGTFAADQWVKIYESILSSAATSITISSLDGDTDEEYRLIFRGVGGNAVSCYYFVRPNNDTGSNYGVQLLYGYNVSVGAIRDTLEAGINLDYGATIDQNSIIFSTLNIQAKSGYLRTTIGKSAVNIATTSVGLIELMGNSWNNTTDNITSLVILADQTNGLGVGTSIELFKKNYKS